MAIRDYEGVQYKSDTSQGVWDSLTVEEAIQININEKPFTVSMRTPGDDQYLVRGILHSEDIINDSRFLPEVNFNNLDHKGKDTIANLNVPEELLGSGFNKSRSLISVSSCGICGKTALNDIKVKGISIRDDKKLDASILEHLFEKMNSFQHNFNQSGGAHAASAFTLSGEELSTKEDIGRHNAVDKVIGELIYNEQLELAKVMTVSGRVSYEIVVKCFKAKIPFLAAVSAPSSLAVDYAKKLGITLFGFCRKDKATCYSHPERVKQSTCVETGHSTTKVN